MHSFRVSGTLPTGQLSNIPWRRTGVKYTNNEAYFDVIEEVDAIIDKSGTTVTAEIQGYVSSFIQTRVCIWELFFLISQPKHMLWVLKRTVSMRWFF